MGPGPLFTRCSPPASSSELSGGCFASLPWFLGRGDAVAGTPGTPRSLFRVRGAGHAAPLRAPSALQPAPTLSADKFLASPVLFHPNMRFFRPGARSASPLEELNYLLASCCNLTSPRPRGKSLRKPRFMPPPFLERKQLLQLLEMALIKPDPAHTA